MVELVPRHTKQVPPSIFFVKELNASFAIDDITKGFIVPKDMPYSRHRLRRGYFIRWWLNKVVADYPLHIHKVFKEASKSLEIEHVPSYASMRKVLYAMKRLRLITPIKTTESKGKNSWDRVYYTLVNGNINHPAWQDPAQYYVNALKKGMGVSQPTGAPACAPGQEPTPSYTHPAPIAKKPSQRRKRVG